MLNGHSIKLPNKAKSLSQQVSATLRLIREVCVVHSGERKHSQLVKEQRLSVYECPATNGTFLLYSFPARLRDHQG